MRTCALRSFVRSLCALATVLIMASGVQQSARAEPSSDMASNTEWAREQIKKGLSVDFAEKCHASVEAANEGDRRWLDDCRALSASVFADVLFGAPDVTVEIVNARIVGDLDAANRGISRSIVVKSSHLEGKVILRHARTASLISFEDSVVYDGFDAEGLRSDNDLILGHGTIFKKGVTLRGAKISGQVFLDSGGRIDGDLDADSAVISSNLLMMNSGNKPARFHKVILSFAKVGGVVDMTGAVLAGDLDANNLEVGGALRLYKIDASGAIDLNNSTIKDYITIKEGHVTGAINIQDASVGGNILMQNASFDRRVSLSNSQFGGVLNVSAAKFVMLDLSRAVIASDLMLDKVKLKTLSLSNARVGNLIAKDGSWPDLAKLSLDGFVFNKFDGGDPRNEKTWGAWNTWMQSDPTYSPKPYAQLAAIMAGSGYREAADDIRFEGRRRETEVTCREGATSTCVVQRLLGIGAGYGIGDYTFRVAKFVIMLGIVGCLVLWSTVPAAREPNRGLLWCLGASFAQLLPLVEVNREFGDFFNDPKRERLKAWQAAFFSGLHVVGWVLGGLLFAALSGLTQSQ